MKAKKSFGQHWLFDQESLEKVVEAAELTKDDFVLEVGPGRGSLTELLARKAKAVIAVEADADLLPGLQAQFALTSNVEIVEQDILKFDLSKLPPGYKVVANIPYYLTSNLIRRLLEAPNSPSIMSLLIQEEVAERIVAKPGQMSILSVSVQYYATAHIVRAVSRELFQPVPNVDSAIIQIVRRPKPAFTADTKKLFRLVKAGFGEKRKMLRNSLSGGLQLPTNEVESLLEQAKLKPTARAQELSLDEWRRLYNSAESVL
ncbi:ribosomal RNA small subunit methyltransferase A [Candidatus Saccharibacteria bacterium]|nr:ribosomal RNA small subunit methyltransferase A [Candidatus Saccharibacteria bacterium]